MDKILRLEIILTNPQEVYWPGQIIYGQLHVDLFKEMKVRAIRIQCRGKCHVHWSEGSGSGEYNSSEDYINKTSVLYGKGKLYTEKLDVKNNRQTEESIYLSAGQHVFPFSFVLPVHLPGSFEGRSSCYVRYWLKGTIDRPWKFDREVKFTFTVGSMLDLNLQPTAMNPFQKQDSTTVRCCCCESGPITAALRIDRTGCVPGEVIIVNAVVNRSGHGAASSKIIFKMGTKYRTHGGSTKTYYTEISRLQHGRKPRRSRDIWRGVQIPVPSLPPSYLQGCSLIDIEYYVELAVDLTDLRVRCPVIIGSIPLRSIVKQYLPNCQPPPVTEQPSAFGGPVNNDIPPPSYQECVLGKVDVTDDDDKHATGNMSYAPSYSYYDWLGTPPQYGVQNSPPSAPTLTAAHMNNVICTRL